MKKYKHIVTKFKELPIWAKIPLGLVFGILFIITLPFIFVCVAGLHIYEDIMDFLDTF